MCKAFAASLCTRPRSLFSSLLLLLASSSTSTFTSLLLPSVFIFHSIVPFVFSSSTTFRLPYHPSFPCPYRSFLISVTTFHVFASFRSLTTTLPIQSTPLLAVLIFPALSPSASPYSILYPLCTQPFCFCSSPLTASFSPLVPLFRPSPLFPSILSYLCWLCSLNFPIGPFSTSSIGFFPTLVFFTFSFATFGRLLEVYQHLFTRAARPAWVTPTCCLLLKSPFPPAAGDMTAWTVVRPG